VKSDEIAREVADLERQHTALGVQLDQLMLASRAEIAARAADWIKREVERQVESQPDKIQALGVEGIRTLKTRIADLTARLPAIVEAETATRTRWPHNTVVVPEESGGRIEESFLGAVFRNTISALGPILTEFNLLDERREYTPSWRRDTTGQLRYAIDPGSDPQAGGPVAQYSKGVQRYRSMEKELEQKRVALAKERARELWNSA